MCYNMLRDLSWRYIGITLSWRHFRTPLQDYQCLPWSAYKSSLTSEYTLLQITIYKTYNIGYNTGKWDKRNNILLIFIKCLEINDFSSEKSIVLKNVFK